jgi:hypothetical protein
VFLTTKQARLADDITYISFSVDFLYKLLADDKTACLANMATEPVTPHECQGNH